MNKRTNDSRLSFDGTQEIQSLRRLMSPHVVERLCLIFSRQLPDCYSPIFSELKLIQDKRSFVLQ
jgi:hypothetical protein